MARGKKDSGPGANAKGAEVIGTSRPRRQGSTAGAPMLPLVEAPLEPAVGEITGFPAGLVATGEGPGSPAREPEGLAYKVAELQGLVAERNSVIESLRAEISGLRSELEALTQKGIKEGAKLEDLLDMTRIFLFPDGMNSDVLSEWADKIPEGAIELKRALALVVKHAADVLIQTYLE